MKKILVVFTGGTIGSTEKDGIINVDERKTISFCHYIKITIIQMPNLNQLK